MKKVFSVKEYIDCIKNIRERNKLGYPIVFRGQSDSSWTIQSTLERAGIERTFLKDYYKSIDYLKTEINSFGHHFQRKMTPNGYDFNFSEWNEICFGRFPDVEYLSYLRHHGFPTPLIDVTQSEYIALFFACEDINEKVDAKVFVFRGNLGCASESGQPELHKIGHYLESDRRHIAQQSEYFLTVQFLQIGDASEWAFVPFSSFLNYENPYMGEGDDGVNVESQALFEIEIAGDAKKNIMADLAKMNINRYTLYLDEDSLIQKLKYDFLQRVKND